MAETMRTKWIASAMVLAIGVWAIGSLGRSAEPAAGPPPGPTATSAKVSPAPTKKETKAQAIALSLAEVVKAINEQARKLPETRRLKPLTEDEVVEVIEKFQRPAPALGKEYSHLQMLTDDEFRRIKSVAQTRRLPTELIVRQFVRYDVGTGMQHGWWVRLNLKRRGASPTVTLRQHVLLDRPYTQLERQFRDDIRRTGRIPTLGRTMGYFDEDPQIGTERKFSAAAAQRLADGVKQVIDHGKADELLKLYCWDKVDAKARKRVENDTESLLKRKLASVVVRPRGFGGRLTHWEGFAYWDPNIPLAGYIVLQFADLEEPSSVCLEFGETTEGARLANYFVSQDEGPKLIGKPMSRGFGVSGFTTYHPDKGWLEFFDELDTPPEEIPALKQINFEIWKMLPKR
jgi:hypothetical protein